MQKNLKWTCVVENVEKLEIIHKYFESSKRDEEENDRIL